jgi:fluoride exporter
MTLLLVAIGGFMGAVFRFFISRSWNRKFPLGTFTTNIIGSFLLGYLFCLGISQTMFALIGSGFCGAFTTFSTFNLEAVQLFRGNRKCSSVVYVVLSYTIGIVSAYGGYLVAK